MFASHRQLPYVHADRGMFASQFMYVAWERNDERHRIAKPSGRTWRSLIPAVLDKHWHAVHMLRGTRYNMRTLHCTATTERIQLYVAWWASASLPAMQTYGRVRLYQHTVPLNDRILRIRYTMK